MDYIDDLNKSLDDWAKNVKLTTHQELAKATFLTILKTNPIISSFSIWLLLISGAAATLVISNLGDIREILSIESIRILLFVLILSGIAGFCVKGISLYIDMYLQINDNLNEFLSKILAEHDAYERKIEEVAGELTDPPDMELDFNFVLNELSEPFPKWYKKKIFRAAEETAKDPLWGHKRYSKLLMGMGVAAITQAIMFIIFVFIVAVSI